MDVQTLIRADRAARQCWPAALGLAAVVGYLAALERLGFDDAAVPTCLAVGFAALLSSFAGFAFSAICGAILFQFRTDAVEIVQIMLICSIANKALNVWTLRRDIQVRDLMPFLAGGVAGAPAGVWVLMHLASQIYTHALGAALLAYGAVMVLRKPLTWRGAPVVCDIAAGFAGGVIGGFAAFPSAPVTIWCGMKGWDQRRQRALTQPFILILQLLTLGIIGAQAPSGRGFGIPPLALACVPVSLAGTLGGLACFRRLTDRQFARAVNLLLITSGAGLLV